MPDTLLEPTPNPESAFLPHGGQTEGNENDGSKPVSMVGRVLNFIRKHIDVEMWQKGWWMLLLIIGTIAVLFVISWIYVQRHQ